MYFLCLKGTTTPPYYIIYTTHPDLAGHPVGSGTWKVVLLETESPCKFSLSGNSRRRHERTYSDVKSTANSMEAENAEAAIAQTAHQMVHCSSMEGTLNHVTS